MTTAATAALTATATMTATAAVATTPARKEPTILPWSLNHRALSLS